MDFGNQTLTLKVLLVLFDLTPFSARPVFVCLFFFCFVLGGFLHSSNYGHSPFS